MLPPAAMSFAAIVASTCFLFVLWHTWHYDRWRCLFYSRQEWFRALICQLLLISVSAFMVYSWIELHVLYDEFYIVLKGKVVPAPWQLWSSHNQNLWRTSIYALCIGWCFIQAVHLEEFLYWGYLIHGIRTPGGPRTSWIKSAFFKVWAVAAICAVALLLGACHIETENLEMMKSYLFIVGSALSCVLAGASTTLCFVFPRFVESVRKQGATYEVLERLHFFAEMNQIRTVFRWVYSLSFMILSADAMTSKKTINRSGFGSDLLYLCGHLGIFTSTCLSVIVLLPRNMTSESLPPKTDENIHPMVPYQRPQIINIDASSPRQFFELGDRLNIDRNAMTNGLAEPGYELRNSSNGGRKEPGYNKNNESDSDFGDIAPPFVDVVDPTRRARFSDLPSLPSVMARFRSPLETASPTPRSPVPTRVFVTTQQIVERG